MKFSDIQDGIQQAWQFLLPPFVNLFVLASLTYYIAPYIFTVIFTRATLVNFSFLRDESFQKFLEFYGVSKLAPVFFVIGLIFILYVVQGVVRSLGHLLPGYIVDFNEGRLTHVLLLDSTRLAELWARFPDVPTIYELVRILSQKLSGVDPKLKSNIENWENRFGKYYRISTALKFYLLWCLLLLVSLMLMRQPVGAAFLRFLSIGIPLLIFFVVMLIKQIYSIEQKAFAELNTIQTALYQDEKMAAYPDREIVKQMSSSVWEFKKHAKVNWWEFRLWDTYQFKWFHTTFIKRKEP